MRSQIYVALLVLCIFLGFAVHRLIATSARSTSFNPFESIILHRNSSGQQPAQVAQTTKPEALGSSPQLQSELLEQSKALSQLKSEIEKKENEQDNREVMLSNLSGDLLNQQSVIQNLEQSQRAEENQFYQNYTSQYLEAQRQKMEQEYALSQLESQLLQGQNELRYYRQKIAQQESLGFVTDLLIGLREKYQNVFNRVQQLQQQYWDAKNQAGQAAALNSLNQEREKRYEFQNLKNTYQRQLETENARYQQLEKQYEEVSNQHSEQAAVIDNLSQKYQTLRSNYSELSSQANRTDSSG